MRFHHSLALLTASTSLLANAAPFTPQLGSLQRVRRRAVDYPIQSFQPSHQEPVHQRRRRALSYSVVQVDGTIDGVDDDDEDKKKKSEDDKPDVDSTTTTTAPPCTETVVLTSTITGPSSEQTIVTTTTRTASSTSSSTSSSSSSSSPPPMPPPARILRAQQITNTVVETVTATPAPTSQSSTSYYDDGLWHTYYPIKTFVPRGAPTGAPSPLTTTSEDDEAKATELQQGAHPHRKARRAMKPIAKAAPAAIEARNAFPIAPPTVDPATEEIGIITKRDVDSGASSPSTENDNSKKPVEVVSWDVNELTRREHKGLERFMRR